MPSLTWTPITIREGIHLRAFAILAILAHNFLHHIADTPGENEFGYHHSRGQDFLAELLSNPIDFTRLIATFFGHYGVQIFLFLSGYGLARKYRDTPPVYFPFLKSRIRALYPSIIIAALAYIVYESFRLGFTDVLQADGLNLVRQMVGLSNFIPDNIYHPIGPWWFISLILQFYLIAPPIIQYAKKSPIALPVALVILTLTLEYTVADPLYHNLDLNINHTIFGHLDTLALGILLAYAPPKDVHPTVPLTALLITLAGNFVAFLWPITFLAVIIATLPVLRKIIQKMEPDSLLTKFFLLTGNLSLLLFLTNGYLRNPLLSYAREHDHPAIHLLYLLAFLLLTYTVSFTLQKTLDRLSQRSKS